MNMPLVLVSLKLYDNLLKNDKLFKCQKDIAENHLKIQVSVKNQN